MQLGNASKSLAPGEVASAVVKFTKCSPAAACQGGGTCAVGYETPDNNCVGCVKQFYKLSGECKPCPDTAGLLLGIYIGVVVIFGIFGLLLVKKGPSVAVTGVGIDYYQVLSIFVGFGIKWPTPVKDVLNIVSISNMNIELVSPQCTIDFDYSQKWLAIEFAPLGLGILALVGYGVVLLKKVIGRFVWRVAGLKGGKKREHGNLHRHANAIIGAIILMFQFIYIYCTKTAFEIFACEAKENGKSYMYFEPEIECWVGIHNLLWPLALVFASLYGIGIPILFTVIVIRNRKVIKQDQVLRVLGTGSSRAENPEHHEFRKRYYKLYYRFKPRYHYWGEVILFRKFLIVLVTVFLRPNPTLQATCAVMILFVSYSVHTRTMPYLRNDLLGCENIEGLDDDDEDDELMRENRVAPLDEGEARKHRMDQAKEAAYEMVNKNAKAVSMRHSAKKLVKKIPSFVKQARSRSAGSRSGSADKLQRTQSMESPEPSVEWATRAQKAGGSNNPSSPSQSLSPRRRPLSFEMSATGAHRADVSAGLSGASVTIVEEEESGNKGAGDDVIMSANPLHFQSSSGVGGKAAPLMTTLHGRRAPRQSMRPPTTQAGLSKEKGRRLSALFHMGEGTSLWGKEGDANALWSNMRSQFVSSNNDSDDSNNGSNSMYGSAAGGAEPGSETGAVGTAAPDADPLMMAGSQTGGSIIIAGGHFHSESTFSDKLYVSKNFLMDYNTMETVRVCVNRRSSCAYPEIRVLLMCVKNYFNVFAPFVSSYLTSSILHTHPPPHCIPIHSPSPHYIHLTASPSSRSFIFARSSSFSRRLCSRAEPR
jgi:hypothetical protein